MEYFLINSTIILLHCVRQWYPKKKSRNKRRLGKENSSCLWFIIADKLEQCLASSRLIKHYEIGDNRDGPILRAFIHENLVRNCHRHCSRNNRDLSRLLAVISCRFRKKRRSIHRRSWKLTIEKYRPLFVALPSLSLSFFFANHSLPVSMNSEDWNFFRLLREPFVAASSLILESFLNSRWRLDFILKLIVN